MINKKNVWFLTLFSLILVLSVYYITMPSELLLNTTNMTPEEIDNSGVLVSESAVLVALRVEAEEKRLEEIGELKSILTNVDSSIDEKNNAFEKMKLLNVISGEEQQIETKIKEQYNLQSFVKIDGDQIRVVIDGSEHNNELANNIMRLVQSNYTTKMYITVKFQT